MEAHKVVILIRIPFSVKNLKKKSSLLPHYLDGAQVAFTGQRDKSSRPVKFAIFHPFCSFSPTTEHYYRELERHFVIQGSSTHTGSVKKLPPLALLTLNKSQATPICVVSTQ